MDISTFVFNAKITKKRMAKDLGISLQYLCAIAKRRSKPSERIANEIERYTRGFVLASEILSGWEKEPKQDPLEAFFEQHLKSA